MKFTYTRVPDSYLPNGIAYLPLLDINLGENKLPIKCLIDSGSPVSIIHAPLGVAGRIKPNPVDYPNHLRRCKTQYTASPIGSNTKLI